MAVKNLVPTEIEETLSGFGLLVREARKARQLSQIELANIVGLNQKTISAIENGATGTELGTIIRVFKALNLRMDVGLLGREETIYSTEDGKMRAFKIYGPDRDSILESLSKVKSKLKEIGVSELVLFGSVARGTAGANSDVDIMVDLSVPQSIKNTGKVEDVLEDAIPFKIDFVLKGSMRPEVLAEAEREGIRVI